MTPEGTIKKLIMDWLSAQPGCYVRVLQIAGFRGRKNVSAGMADIIGVWKGWALAIEVKAKTKASEGQKEFLELWKRSGGIAIVARSLDDVIAVLKPTGEKK